MQDSRGEIPTPALAWPGACCLPDPPMLGSASSQEGHLSAECPQSDPLIPALQFCRLIVPNPRGILGVFTYTLVLGCTGAPPRMACLRVCLERIHTHWAAFRKQYSVPPKLLLHTHVTMELHCTVKTQFGKAVHRGACWRHCSEQGYPCTLFSSVAVSSGLGSVVLSWVLLSLTGLGATLGS